MERSGKTESDDSTHKGATVAGEQSLLIRNDNHSWW